MLSRKLAGLSTERMNFIQNDLIFISNESMVTESRVHTKSKQKYNALIPFSRRANEFEFSNQKVSFIGPVCSEYSQWDTD